MIIVSDTTPLSELAKVGQLNLLRDIFGILLVAKQQGLIPTIKDILDGLIVQGKYINSRLYQEALLAAQE